MENKCLFRVGDRVWSLSYGWGRVVAIYGDMQYPVKVKFDKTKTVEKYTEDGKLVFSENRTLFFEELNIPQSALDRPISRKTAEELLDECEDTAFEFNKFNYFIFKTSEGKIRWDIEEKMKLIGMKYISYKDAERIVKECKENN